MPVKLYDKCLEKGFKPKHVMEVGVYYSRSSNIIDFIADGVNATLIEPNPRCIEELRHAFQSNSHVKIMPFAITEQSERVKLFNRGESSFLAMLEKSPALVNDGYKHDDKDALVVEGKRFSEIDDGSIDLISIDTEGSEWFTIKNMKSKPAVISVEMHGKFYRNPHHDEIDDWMKRHAYKLWYKTSSDCVYAKPASIRIDVKDKIFVQVMNLRLQFRRSKILRLLTRPFKNRHMLLKKQ